MILNFLSEVSVTSLICSEFDFTGASGSLIFALGSIPSKFIKYYNKLKWSSYDSILTRTTGFDGKDNVRFISTNDTSQSVNLTESVATELALPNKNLATPLLLMLSATLME